MLSYVVVNNCLFAASTVIGVETTPVQRQIQQEIKVYLEFLVPEDGFTVKVEIEVGTVAVCGSNWLERPDCSYNLTYDWKMVVSDYKEVFIGPDGYPVGSHNSKNISKFQTANSTNKSQPVLDTNNTAAVYVTIEGLDTDNVFLFNTTYGDTRTPKGNLCSKRTVTSLS